MNSKALVVLLALACVATWFALRSSADEPPALAPDAGVPTAAAAVAAADVAHGAVDRPAVARDVVADRATAPHGDAGRPASALVTIRGRLVDENGLPRAATGLSLSSWGSAEGPDLGGLPLPGPGPERRGQPKFTTASDGTFHLPLAADLFGSIELVDDEMVFATAAPTVDGRKGDQDLGDVVAVRSGVLKGVVRDEHGQPVAEVKVSATFGVLAFGTTSTATTDAKGVFSIGKLRPGTWTLRTASGRFLPASQEERLGVGERREDLVLVLRPGQAIAGQVIDDRGVPVAACKVGSKRKEARGGIDIERFSAAEAATTDANGFFTLSGLSGDAVTVRTFDARHTSGVAIDVPVGTGNLVLRIERLAAVAGVLLGVDGTPIAGSRIRATLAGRSTFGGPGLADGFESFPIGEGRAAATTGADGTFRIEGVRPGQVTVVAEGRTHRPVHYSSLEVRPGQLVEGLRLVADPGVVAKVTVVDADGKPVAGATVRMERPGVGNGGAQGRRRAIATAESEDVRVGVDFGGEESIGSATTDASGLATIAGLPEGAAVVTASHQDHAKALPVTVDLPKAGVVETSLTLRAPGFVEVLVVDVDGATAANCSVLVRGPVQPPGSAGEVTGTTGPQGLARLGPLPPGDYTVQLARGAEAGHTADSTAFVAFRGEGGIASTEQAFAVVAGRTTRVEVRRPQMTRLHGSVTGIEGPVAACVVELSRPDEEPGIPGFGGRTVTTAADGTFAFEDVEAGAYTLHFGKQDQVVKASVAVDVPANTPQLRQDLVLRTGRLRLQAVDKETGEAVAGATVEIARPPVETEAGAPRQERRIMMVAISSDDGEGESSMMTVGAQRAVTGADGWADVDDVPVGAYDVRVTHDGHTAVGKARQVVVERQTTDCGRVELQRAGRLRGKVLSADGRPVDYALVESRPVDALQWSEPQVVMEGSFRMDALAPGRHLVRARPMSQHPGEGELFGPEVEVVIAGGKTVTTEVRLPAK